MSSIIYIAILIMLYIIIDNILSQAPFFQKANPKIMSLCVATLCVLGIHHLYGEKINFLLLPYAALAIALLAILFLKWLTGFGKTKNVNAVKGKTPRSKTKG